MNLIEMRFFVSLKMIEIDWTESNISCKRELLHNCDESDTMIYRFNIMPNKHQSALEYANTWMDIIHRSELPSRENAQWIIDESIHNFSQHFNRGWLEQRKSVNTQRSGWAAVEWSGDGAQFTDVLGRKYIDFLGGYGLMSLGWSHSEVVEAVRSQLLCNPMPSQELIDPLRGALARIMADTLPGDISYSFFAASGTEANEGAIKLAKLHTGKSAFIAATNGFHGKTMGSLSMMGKALYREPVGQLYGGPVYHIPFGDADALQQQLEICKSTGVGVAGVIFEPIQ